MAPAGNFLAEINHELADVLAEVERQGAQDYGQSDSDDGTRRRAAQVRRLLGRGELRALPCGFKGFIHRRRNIRTLAMSRSRLRAERATQRFRGSMGFFA